MDGNGMLLLISFIILMGCLVYMIILSNEMSKIIDRLLGRTKRLLRECLYIISRELEGRDRAKVVIKLREIFLA